eukprot:CAMPEP_0184750706 /NCGR_PEP_ID=MMETSP0315-20130426/38262_1 /TAXON_ID=101924 /ORGANISM="Rhodosorus marinus, Strain UTEX LB 2760" /LENGTH=301 /DNA_ID=CAMNT_0027229199 /DNA_START=271 /DNA_END=1176 /DNA_ORIENTATION=-
MGRRWLSTRPVKVNFPRDVLARLVQETGATLLTCRLAMYDANGDVDRAREILRFRADTKYLFRSVQQKRSGLVIAMLSRDQNSAALLKLSSETNFASRSADFRNTLRRIGNFILTGATEQGAVDKNWLKRIFTDQVSHLAKMLNESIMIDGAYFLRAESKAQVICKSVLGTVESSIGTTGVLLVLESSKELAEQEISRVRHAGKLIAAQIAEDGHAYQATNQQSTKDAGLHFRNDDDGRGSIYSKSLTVLPRTYRANETVEGLLRSLGDPCTNSSVSIETIYQLSSINEEQKGMNSYKIYK